MELNRIVKWVVIVALGIAVWKVGVPWAKKQNFFGDAASATGGKSGAGASCPRAAANASAAWGDGLGRFVNPPYDLDAWSSFRSGVDAKIGDAESQCGCAEDSCAKAREAMGELRSLVSELDTSIRGGSAPPEDLVRRQERIDNLIDEAADSLRSGK
jgi:hypothetical protein